MPSLRFRSYRAYLENRFGERVRKVTLEAGFTCPNRDGRVGRGGCTYCNNVAFNPNQRTPGASIVDQMRRGMEAASVRYRTKKFIAYFQAYTNTYGSPGELARKYEEALANEAVVGLSIGTRPDCLSEEALGVLEEFSRRAYLCLEIGLQSSHDRTLARINRGHDFACFTDAVGRARKRALEICAHVILGLPGESREDMMATASALSEMDVQGVKIHALCVCRDTPMEKDYAQGKVRVLSQEEFVDWTCDFLERLRPDILIHRLGTDVPADLLVAPAWVHNRQAVLRQINEELERRNTEQGARWVKSENWLKSAPSARVP